MDRRRFLKYAAVGVAVAGSGLVGYEFERWQTALVAAPTKTYTETVTSLSIETLTRTTTSSRTVTRGTSDLELSLFADWHGDGKQQSDEPGIKDLQVDVSDSAGNFLTTVAADSDGKYWVRNVQVGKKYVILPKTDRFKYISISNSEIRDIAQGYAFQVLSPDDTLSVGLMEGFLTLPIQVKEFRLGSYVDLDPGPGTRDWKGGTQTYDGHPGTDFLASEGVDVLAAGPGRIFAAASGWPNKPSWTGVDYYRNNGNFVMIDHGNGLYIAYHHLKSITVDETPWASNGPMVSRGQTIGQVGTTGVTSVGGSERITVPHLHLQVWNGSGFMYGRVDALDPFRDLYYGKHGLSPWSDPESLWSKDNDPQSPLS